MVLARPADTQRSLPVTMPGRTFLRCESTIRDYNAAAEGELEIGPIIDGVRLRGRRLVTRPGLGGRNSWLRSRKLCPSKSPCFSSDCR